MPEWPTTPLSSLLTQHVPSAVAPAPDDIVQFAGVRWYGDGLFVREERRGAAIKGKIYALKPGTLIYNRLFAWKQSFAVVGDEFEGVVVSNEFPQFDVDPSQATPEFLALYCSSPSFAEEALNLSTGAAAVSRNRLKEPDFLTLPAPVPPLAVQAGIVEVVTVIDAVIKALEAEIDAAAAVRVALLGELLRRRDETWEERPVGDLGTIIRGKRFVKSDYVPEGIGCIHYSQIHTDFGAHTAEVRTRLPEEMRSKLRFAAPGNLVIAGTSENVEGVLKAVAWLGDDSVAVHDDAYIFDHSLEPRFAAHLFVSPAFREQVERVYSDTKVVRVSRDNLARLVVPVPPRAKQAEISDAMDAMDQQITTTAAELDSARLARAALRDALLDRRIEVILPAPSTDESDE
ncbi:hypothetical protein HG717_06880 [Rhodococcus erythropolis]|uniref:restriction endonuclease subunit S n=1 Tax=Rhodococcus erythropolis TaxID=1833 RepID=UPI001C9AD17E|nr:restriction endonuclease subunit S [Rhodococcus erythropolis]MBY6383639.1 hypothetical protein [Rhodococcus erythropolis]